MSSLSSTAHRPAASRARGSRLKTASAAAALALTFTMAAAAPAMAGAPPRYTAVDLGVVRDTYGYTPGINAAGDVAGMTLFDEGSGRVARPVLFSGGSVTPLGAPGGDPAWAHDINNTGTIVGVTSPPQAPGARDRFIATSWTASGAALLPALSGGTDSYAYAVNDSGLIVGWSAVSDERSAAVSWRNGAVTALPDLLPGDFGGSQAFGVNSAGAIVGQSVTLVETLPGGGRSYAGHPVVWKDGVVMDLGTLGGYGGIARDINDAGWIVGHTSASGSEGVRPTLWKDGAVVDLGLLPGAVNGTAYGVNNAGDILGSSNVPGRGAVPFLYQDGVMYDFLSLLEPGSPVSSLAFGSSGINDAGQFSAVARVDGELRMFLFQPVPEPGAAGLAVLAMTGALLVRRRRVSRRDSAGRPDAVM